VPEHLLLLRQLALALLLLLLLLLVPSLVGALLRRR
jgi:hypothetical protein